MNKIGLLTVFCVNMFFWCSAQSSFQNSVIHNVMYFNLASGISQGINIQTNIPINEDAVIMLNIEGFNGEHSHTVGLRLGWEMHGSQPEKYVVSSSGSFAPKDVVLYDFNGNVAVFLTIEGHQTVLRLSVDLDAGSASQGWLENWELIEGPMPIAQHFEVPVMYQNEFRGYSKFEQIESLTGAFQTVGATSSYFTSSVINRVTSSSITTPLIEVKTSPVAGQQDITKLLLTSKNSTGGDYSWGFFTAPAAGGFGVTANGLDVFEYPDNGNWAGGCCRPRLSIQPSRKNNVDQFKAVVINPNGSLALGYQDFESAKNHSLSENYFLLVNGDIKARKLKVTTTGWPDYVFEPEYKLRSLESLEKFIKKYKHLPEIPDSAQIDNHGQDVGEVQKMLLKKIEELTLYVIELQKQVDALKTLKP